MSTPSFLSTNAFQTLTELVQTAGQKSPVELFSDPERFAHFSLQGGGVFLDYSKNLIDQQVMDGLVQLAQERNIKQQIQDWLGGGPINTSENRPALHTLLRASADSQWAGLAEYQMVQQQTQSMMALYQSLERGEYTGCTGKPIQTIVNIGIGGSAMGVQAAYDGLAMHPRRRTCRFIVNIDPANSWHQLDDLDLEATLFLVSSKSFTTLETLTNYRHALSMLCDRFDPEQASQHFFAITASPDKAQAAGFAAQHIIVFPDWVGGRFSLWSAVGTPILLCYGEQVWLQMLRGAENMDKHLAEADIAANVPVCMALVSLWQRSFLGINNHAVLCYSHDLRSFAEHLQQLIMESNGKSVLSGGEPVGCATGEMIWGGENSNGQHSYFQWLHQASELASGDFIVPCTSNYARQETHEQLVAMAFGQSRALFFGDKQEGLEASTTGKRQSNTVMIDRLNSETFGALVALYEHRTVVMAMLWGINPFDQWGVEAGKKSANALYPYIQETKASEQNLDVSTAGLIQQLLHYKE